MSDVFLENFMYAAKQITHAERCMVVNTDLQPMATENVDLAMIESTAFGEFALSCLRKSISTNEVIITNNVITDPLDAPTTNTNFANLRVIVVVPLKGSGALYLDQHIRNGVIARQTVERLMQLAQYLVGNKYYNKSAAEMVQFYQELEPR